MIHQFIFAGPKPGLAPAAFQSYWVHFHAVDYARKIPQIRRYLVATREPVQVGRDVAFFQGVAEIWLANDEEQLASLQSVEFLEGARRDEPRWAAFWQTFVLDTESQTAWQSDDVSDGAALVKMYVLMKRQPASARRDFQASLLGGHAALVRELPALVRHTVGFARDNQYGFGEPRFDAVEIFAFPDAAAVEPAVRTQAFRAVEGSWRSMVDDTARFTFVGRDHWIIAPGERRAGVPLGV